LIDRLPHNNVYTAKDIARFGLILTTHGTPSRGLSATCRLLKRLFPENTTTSLTRTGVRAGYSGAKLNMHNDKMLFISRNHTTREALPKNLGLLTDSAQVINMSETVGQIQ
jgi:hypothetical protein